MSVCILKKALRIKKNYVKIMSSLKPAQKEETIENDSIVAVTIHVKIAFR